MTTTPNDVRYEGTHTHSFPCISRDLIDLIKIRGRKHAQNGVADETRGMEGWGERTRKK